MSEWKSAIRPFELPFMNAHIPGTTFNSANFPDTVLVIEAYFQGCHYCNDNADAVNRLAQSYFNNLKVKVLDIGIDQDDSQYKAWIRDHNPNHPVLKDAKREVVGQLGASGYPSTYVLNTKREVVHSSDGTWEDQTERDIRQAIEKALK